MIIQLVAEYSAIGKIPENIRLIMPTVLRIGPYRFFFYSGDRAEPPHIHIERDAHVAKFWLDPVRLHSSGGFRRRELRELAKMVEQNQAQLLRSWDEFFDN